MPADGREVQVEVRPGSAGPVCYYASLARGEGAPPAHYFSTLLAHRSGPEVQLAALLATGCDCSGVRYPNASAPWDHAVTAAAYRPSARLSLPQGEVERVQAGGIFLCASAGADATAAAKVSLFAAGHSCPLALHDNGFVSICSSSPTDVRFLNDTCPDAVCQCSGPWAKPASPVMPGLGFEDCSAAVTSLPPDSKRASEEVTDQPPGTWTFFNFTVAPGERHVWAAAAATANTSGRVQLFLRRGQPPSSGLGDFDTRSDMTDFSGDLAVTASSSVADPFFAPGLWYAGVRLWGDAPASYTFSLLRSACPGDCSGRGTCEADTGVCSCEQPSFTGPDCSTNKLELQLGKPAAVAPRTFGDDLLTLPGAGEALTSAPGAMLRVNVSFSTDRPLPEWVTSRPVLLLSGQPPHPTTDTAPMRIPMQEAGQQYSAQIDASQVPSGTLYLTLHNPLSHPYQVGYEVSVTREVRCPFDCNGRGTCGEDGRCMCTGNWAGPDCSVDITPGLARCQPGTTRPDRVKEALATCWRPCSPDTGAYVEDTCSDFTCDPLGPDGKPQRRQGAAQACVQDACAPGSAPATVTDASGDFVCDKRCVCPEGGAACGLASGCEPGSVKCLKGLTAQEQPDGSVKCVPGAPGSCQEGSLLRSRGLEGGEAYAVCTCTGSSTGGSSGNCSYSQPQEGSNVGGVVVCQQGYEVTGSTPGAIPLSDGTSLASGGRCTKAQHGRRGVSGGMVFFYCLLSIGLAAGMVVGGKHAWEWWQARRFAMGAAEGGYFSLGFDPFTGRRDAGVNDHW